MAQEAARLHQPQDSAQEPRPAVSNVKISRRPVGKYSIISVAKSATSEFSESRQEPEEYYHNGKSSLWTDWWVWEILSGTFSVSCLVAIFIILFWYENQEIPNIPYGITLNAIISTLATFAKSSLLLAVSAAISQYKWIWYGRRSRKMKGIQTFEDASRGPLGSLVMLSSKSTWSLASLGALVVLTSLAVDPFVQQVLKYRLYTVMKPSDAAIASYSRSFGDGGDSNPSIFNIRTALSDALSGTNSLPRLQCPSGNCTWPPFRSTAWCNKCTNVKDVIEMEGCNFNSTMFSTGLFSTNEPCTFTIPGGWSTSANISIERFSGSDVVVWLPKTLVWPLTYNLQASEAKQYDVHMTNSTFDGIANPLITLGYVSLNFSSTGLHGKEYVKEAYTCSLFPCVNTFNVSVTDGVPAMDVLGTDFGHLFMATSPEPGYDPDPNSGFPLTPDHLSSQIDHWYSTALDDGSTKNSTWLSWLEGVWHTGSALNFSDEWWNSTYWVNTTSAQSLYADLGTLCTSSVGNMAIVVGDLSGNATVTGPFSNSSGNGSVFEAAGNLALLYSTEAVGLIDNAPSFPDLMSNVAKGLTVIYQSNSRLTVSGSEGRVQTHLEVSWVWLMLPTAVVVLGNAFLAIVIIKTKMTKTQIWKDSALAMIYHGYNKSPQVLMRMERISAMEENANELEVEFKRDEGSGLLGWH